MRKRQQSRQSLTLNNLAQPYQPLLFVCGCLTVRLCVMAQAFDSDQLTITDSCGDSIRHHRQVAGSLKAKGRLGLTVVFGEWLWQRRYSSVVTQSRSRKTEFELFSLEDPAAL